MNINKMIEIMERMKEEREIQLDVLNYYMEQIDKHDIYIPSIVNDLNRSRQEIEALELATKKLKFFMLPICKKEPIKLKQWEYDMLDTNDMPHSRRFNDFKTYKHMLAKGHFKGIKDTNMSLDDILSNCIVIPDNNYSFVEVRK